MDQKSKYTPETLREGLPMPIGVQPDEQEWLDVHADAWAKDKACIEALERLHLAIRETGRATLPGRVAALVFTTQIRDALSALREAEDE